MRRFIRRGRSPQLTHKEYHLSRALFSSTFFPSICRLLPVAGSAKKALTIIGTFSIWIDEVNFTPRVVDLSTTSLFSRLLFFPRSCAGQWNIPTETEVLRVCVCVYIYIHICISHKGFSWAIQIARVREEHYFGSKLYVPLNIFLICRYSVVHCTFSFTRCLLDRFLVTLT